MTGRTGPAGRIAAAFIPSKLTPLVIVASLLLGVYAVVALPREEEPQIIVPMIDVFVDMPGASPTEVEQRVTRPLEKLLWEIPGVEYLYSTSSPGRAMIVVRFLVGQDDERALVRLNEKLASNAMRLPPGASGPLVHARSIDHVPVMALTLWGEPYDDVQLRAMAAQLQETLKELPDISEVTIIGGRPRRVTIDLDPAALAARALDPLAVQRAAGELGRLAGVRLRRRRAVAAIAELGRVDADQPHGGDAPAEIDADGVAVDHGGDHDALRRLGRRRRGGEQGERRESQLDDSANGARHLCLSAVVLL